MRRQYNRPSKKIRAPGGKLEVVVLRRGFLRIVFGVSTYLFCGDYGIIKVCREREKERWQDAQI